MTTSPRRWQRHDLAHVHPGVRLPETPAGRWLADGGWGVVGRSEAAGRRVRLGVCLPDRGPDDGKPPRGACEVAPGELADVRPPFTLTEVLPSIPPAWRDGLASLGERGAALSVRWRVFGSLSWRHQHGGRGFVNLETSDADLRFTPAGTTPLDAALDLLHRFHGPPRLDGEVIFPGGLGVAWRELLPLAGGAHRRRRVLVKRLDGVDLRETAALRALLPP